MESGNLGIKLIEKYFQEVDAVKKNKELCLEEKLSKVLAPLIELHNYLHPDQKDIPNYDDIDIDLTKEIDCRNLCYDQDKYDISGILKIGGSSIIEPGDRCIWLNDKYKSYLAYGRDICKRNKPVTEAKWNSVPYALIISTDRLSLEEVYDLWLPSLTKESIVSRDLLQQILVCYTIKRAQKGDEEAVIKLHGLYEERARSHQTVETVKRLLSYRSEPYYDEDIKQKASEYLWLILAGFNPQGIIKSLTKKSEKFKLPRKIKDCYFTYFTEEVPEKLINSLRALLECAKVRALTRKVFQDNESSHNIDSTPLDELKKAKKQAERKITNLHLTLEVLCDPYHLIEGFWATNSDSKIRLHYFNGDCYKPDKMGATNNLTLWLFGAKRTPQYGKLYQLVKDALIPETDYRINTTPVEIESNENEDVELGEMRTSLERKYIFDEAKRISEETEKQIEDRDYIECLLGLMKNSGVLQRDIDIFVKREVSQESAEDIQKEYGIGERQQEKICKKIKGYAEKVSKNLEQ